MKTWNLCHLGKVSIFMPFGNYAIWEVTIRSNEKIRINIKLVTSHLYQRSFVPKWKIGPICTKIIQLDFWLVELWANELLH